jgi:two-component system response regulator HydG
MPDTTVLIVDDEQDLRDICCEALQDAGYGVETAGSGEEALAFMGSAPVDILLSDIKMPGMTGLELLKRAKEISGQIDVVLMTGHATVDNAIEALRLGATDYITKPFALDELTRRLESVAERKELRVENRLLREQLTTGRGPGGMVGTSSRMQELYRLIVKVARHNQPALILGESGTGKELVARAIHECGPNHAQPFVPVDCGALSPTLMESELFGYVPGAFTGAAQRRVGLLASAGKGTVFLDEIGELPLEMQAKLLRSIQEREVRALGSNQHQRLEARILAATNRHLESAIKEGKFREDLYFRLNVLSLRTPPLRERREDIPALVAAFIDRESGGTSTVTGISREAMQLLSKYPWPGNVRELSNYIYRAMALSEGPVIQVRDLPLELRQGAAESDRAELPKMQAAEKQAIVEALASTGGHRVEAAKLLGIAKTTLYKKLKDYGLDSAAL